MPIVQLLLQTDNYERDLSALLSREGCEVVRCTAPDFTREGVVVADRKGLDNYPDLLNHPDRVVLIAPNDGKFLSTLWQHGVRSVVFETDPPGTVVLAILGNAIGTGQVSATRPSNNLIVLGSH